MSLGFSHSRTSVQPVIVARATLAVIEKIEARMMLSAQPVPEINPVTHTGKFEGVEVQASRQAPTSPLDVLPTSYDLRNVGGVNFVTPVKDQGPYGTCWTFATMGSLESSILRESLVSTDLSENNLKNYHGFDWGPGDGGNSSMSEAYLSRFSGPVSEANDPYHAWDDRVDPAPSYPPQYYVKEMLRFDTASEMKTALMNYGALYTNMYWDDYSYRLSDFTYYYNYGTGGNHGVTIVGWDDAKPTAGGTGAWLIKNSWGSWWGNAGYFWMSYNDTAGAKFAESFRAAAPASTYSGVYDWNTFGDLGELSTPYGMNRFVASANAQLKAVGLFTEADNASYTIKVYDTYSGGVLSSLLSTTSGTATYAGYHAIDLPSAVTWNSGNDIYISVGITNGGSYPMAMDYRYGGYTSAATSAPGQSYYSFTGTSWTDLTTFDSTANFAIKALVGAAAVAPGTPANPSPANNAYQTSKPLTLDWSDCANATSYDVYLGNATTPTASVTVSQYGPITPAEGTLQWHVVAKNGDVPTTGPTWQFTMDSVAPVATYGAQTPSVGAATMDFTVTYADVTSGMDSSSVGAGDVLVTGPNGFSQTASFVSVVGLAGTVATYRITAPGGTWNVLDNGTYTVSQVASQVKDQAGNYRSAGAIGSFNAALPFAWMNGSVMTVEFTAGGQTVQLGKSGSNVTATLGGTTLSFSSAGVAGILACGTNLNDTLEFAGAITQPVSYLGTGGNDALNVTAGVYTLCDDACLTTDHLSVSVAAGGSVAIDGSQHLAGLSIAGNVTMIQNGGRAIVTDAIAFTGNGRLDLKDNDLVIRNGVAGSWNGSAYTGVTEMVAAGCNGGAWDGVGIVTSMSSATGGNTLTTLGVARAADALGIGVGETVLWGSQVVDGACVLVKYTYSGDANLDGSVTGDDYFQIDSAYPQKLRGWLNGDFDYNGDTNGDDYFLIDSAYPQQSVVL
jgi:C1A family cysteine protease